MQNAQEVGAERFVGKQAVDWRPDQSLRKDAGLTQAEFSDKVGMARPTLAGIEIDNDLPGRQLLFDIAKAFSVSLDWLVNGVGNMREAKALTENETLLLNAFRQLPSAEADLYVQLLCERVKAIH